MTLYLGQPQLHRFCQKREQRRIIVSLGIWKSNNALPIINWSKPGKKVTTIKLINLELRNLKYVH